MNATTPKIETTVTLEKMFDSDYSPLDYLFQDPDYQKQDQERYDAWKRDEWHFVGTRVVVEIHNWSTGNTVEYKSRGLWGTESDCPDSYFIELASEHLAELQAEYPELKNVDVSNLKIKFSY